MVCGITLLDLDHTDVLGDTIEEIAWHKAGICKPGSRVVVGHQEYPETLQVITKRAEELGVSIICFGKYHIKILYSMTQLMEIFGQ